MKKWTKLMILFLLITNSLFIFTTVKYKNSNFNYPVLKVYSFEGESSDIKSVMEFLSYPKTNR